MVTAGYPFDNFSNFVILAFYTIGYIFPVLVGRMFYVKFKAVPTLVLSTTHIHAHTNRTFVWKKKCILIVKLWSHGVLDRLLIVLNTLQLLIVHFMVVFYKYLPTYIMNRYIKLHIKKVKFDLIAEISLPLYQFVNLQRNTHNGTY